MGISDRLKQLTKKAENTAAEHKEQIKDAVEKAEVAADRRSGGKYHDPNCRRRGQGRVLCGEPRAGRDREVATASR
jgi:hypothetical protein